MVGTGTIVYVSPDSMYVSYKTYHNIYSVRGMVEPALMLGLGSGASS